LSGEPGWDENVLTFRIGDGSSTPPRIITDKSTGNFNLSSASIGFGASGLEGVSGDPSFGFISLDTTEAD
jgi:hypothetical protein